MERKIGEIFKVDGVKLKCLKYLDDCADCYFLIRYFFVILKPKNGHAVFSHI